jgi:hypothetical protein
MPEIVLSDVGDVVRSVPAFLGFHPAESLVLLIVSERGLAVIRADLHDAASHFDEVWDMVTRVRKTVEVTALFAVVVSQEKNDHVDLVREVDRRAHQEGVPLHSAVWVETVAKDGLWRSYLDFSEGVIPDPDTATATVLEIYDGKVILESREALVDALVPTAPADALARRTQLISHRVCTLDLEHVPELTRRAAEQARAGHLPETDEEIAELTAALHFGAARDEALVAMTRGDLSSSIALWHHVVRNLARDDQGHPLTMLAVVQMLNNDCVAASVAIDQALAVETPSPLPGLLRSAIRCGMSSDDLRDLIAASVPDRDQR